jgi:hypothetical protein
VLEEATDTDRESDLDADYVTSAFKSTLDYWRDWVGLSHYRGRWLDSVNRSALVLKLLTSRRTWIDRCCRDLRAAGERRRKTQLGLPLHVDA